MENGRVLIGINELKPGMTIAQEIIIDDIILVRPKTIVTDEVIRKLRDKYFESKVAIYCEDIGPNEELQDKEENIGEIFNEFSSHIEEMFGGINSKGKTDIDEVRSFAKRIQEDLNSPFEVVKDIVLHGSGNDTIYRHSVNVAALSNLFGNWLGLQKKELNLLTYSAILHDFGKTKIPRRILDKQGKLDESEWKQIKSHPIVGYNYIKNVPFLDSSVGYGVLMHHERIDGSGYPLGLKGGEIHSFGKIIAIADTFDAVNSDRYYKQRKNPFEALELIQKESLERRLDYEYSKAFIEHMVNYYMGENVLLNDGKTYKIVQINVNDLLRPLLFDGNEFIDLKNNKELYVTELVL